MMCHCCKQDEIGNFLYPPCCDHSGICESDATTPETLTGTCIHCGAEMFKENGIWWHRSQEDIPIDDSIIKHDGK